MAPTFCNDARSKVATGGGRSVGGSTLTVLDASRYQSVSGSAPSVESPAKLTVVRYSESSYSVVTVLKCVGRAGNVLTIDGATDGYSDAAVLEGDSVFVGPTAGDMDALWAGIESIPKGDTGEQGPQGEQGPPGDPGPNTVAGLIVVPTDGSIALDGSGTVADPYKPRAVERETYTWTVAADGGGSPVDAPLRMDAPWDFRILRVRLWAAENPADYAAANVKVNGTPALSTDIQTATASTATVTVAGPATTYSAGAAVLASFTRVPEAAKLLTLAVTIQEVA